MASVSETDRVEEEVFDFVRKAEEASLAAGRKFTKSIGDFLPVEVPAVGELMKGIFDFTEEILKTQREFAQKILVETHSTLDKTSRKVPVRRAGVMDRTQAKTP